MKYRDKVIKSRRRKSQMGNMLPSAYENDITDKVIQIFGRVQALTKLGAGVRDRIAYSESGGDAAPSGAGERPNSASPNDSGASRGAGRKEEP
jgi:hypothetical protein